MLNITGENFDTEVLNSNQVVLVDFWAPWCGQCKQLNPILEQLEKECGEQIKFVKIDISDSEGVAARYYVSLLPTVLIFTSDGKLAKRLSGLNSKAYFLNKIQETLDNKLDDLY
jgi:thioredoxin 1